MPITIRSPSRYGWIPSLPDRRDYKLIHPQAKVAALPSNIDLSAGMPPVWDQGQAGSCVGHACSAAFAYNAIRQGIDQWTPSRLFVYWNARALEGTTASDAGAQIRDGIKGLVEWGAPPETDWPYDDTKACVQPPTQAFADAKQHLVSSYLSVDQNVDAICTTLAGGEPVVFGFSCYESFESDAVAQTGILNLPAANEAVVGGHAVCLVGYDDATSRFQVRNSWGPDWGQQNGYFTMPYNYVADTSLASDFWVVRQVL